MELQYKFTTTMKELRAAMEYADKNGSGGFKAVTLTVTPNHIGSGLGISAEYDGEPEDITDYLAW